MRLPRRTPFYAPAAEELAYVHALLYGDRSDLRALEGALGVVRLWMNRMACPQAVESTAPVSYTHLTLPTICSV